MISRDVEMLHPKLKPLAMEFLRKCRALNINVNYACTYRSIDAQNELYSIGRDRMGNRIGRIVTRAKGGQSAHNFGLAFDIVVVYGGKYAPDTHPYWKLCGKIGEELGLEWYGNPKSKFFELAHFQIKDWKTYVVS